MTKPRRVLAAAAALVLAGGTTLAIALRDAGVAENMTCVEWCEAVKPQQDTQRHEFFYLAIQAGTPIPEAHGNRVLGECAEGVCTIKPHGCECPVVYTYERIDAAQVAGWSLYRVRAPTYVAGGWRKWANDNPTLVRWYASYKQVMSKCTKHFTGPECLQLLGGVDNGCFHLDTGEICRYGKLVRHNGVGPDPACPTARIDGVFPCVVDRGAGSEWEFYNAEHSDAQMDNEP